MVADPSGSLPQVRRPRSMLPPSSSPRGVVRRPPRWTTNCGRVAGSPANVTGSGPLTSVTAPGRSWTAGPPSGTTHASPCSIATRPSGASSCIRTDQGGRITTRRRIAPRPRGPSRRLASASTPALYAHGPARPDPRDRAPELATGAPTARVLRATSRSSRVAWKTGAMVGYAVAHLDEIEEFADAGSHYRPIRHHLGITAFGVTAWTAHAAGDPAIKEHDEEDATVDQ